MTSLATILRDHLGATELPICDLDSSCCPSSFEVIDFDKVKDKFCEIFSIPEHAKLASADGLYIDEANKIVCFIEMKDVNQFVTNTLPQFIDGSKPDTDPEHFREREFRRALDFWLDDKNRGLRLKIADSLFIALSSLTKYSSGSTDALDLLDKSKVELRYIALLNTSSRDFVKYRLANLNQKLAYGMLTGVQCTPTVIRAVKFDDYVASELA